MGKEITHVTAVCSGFLADDNDCSGETDRASCAISRRSGHSGGAGQRNLPAGMLYQVGLESLNTIFNLAVWFCIGWLIVRIFKSVKEKQHA